jgi:hypothetical protein
MLGVVEDLLAVLEELEAAVTPRVVTPLIIPVVAVVEAIILVVTVVLVSSSSVIELDKQRINKVPYMFI